MANFVKFLMMITFFILNQNDGTPLDWTQFKNCLQPKSSEDWKEFRKCALLEYSNTPIGEIISNNCVAVV